MFIGQPLPFVTAYVEELDSALREIAPDAGMSRLQKSWVSFCLLAIVVTNSICWKRFERASLGRCSHAALSWMFRQSHAFWQFVLRASVCVIVERYGITEGVLVVDDSLPLATSCPTSPHRRQAASVHRWQPTRQRADGEPYRVYCGGNLVRQSRGAVGIGGITSSRSLQAQ